VIKRIAILSTAVLAVSSVSAGASAQTFSPNPVSSFTMSGDVFVSRDTSVVCRLTIMGEIASGGASASMTSVTFAPGDWQCGWFVVSGGTPWTITPTSTSTASVSLSLGSLFACSGTAYATWTNGAPSAITFPGPVVGSSPACTITGTLHASGSVTIM